MPWNRKPTWHAALPAGIVAAVTTLGASAQAHRAAARAAEARNPPKGTLLDIDGIPTHVHIEGRGRPIVLVHGNGAMAEDFLSSPLHAMLVRRFTVHTIDRPGFGHTRRPDGWDPSPEAQGRFILRVMRRLGLRRPVVVGHSWGTLPVLSLAIEEPSAVAAIVLASGFYHPPEDGSGSVAAWPSIPGLGDLLRGAITPAIGRMMWPTFVRKVFAPNPVTEGFEEGFPKALALRPSQLKAVSQDTRAMAPGARRVVGRIKDLTVPLVLIAGREDAIVDTDRHSVRLAREVPDSRLHLVPHAGHMIHHVAPDRVLAAVDEVDRLAP